MSKSKCLFKEYTERVIKITVLNDKQIICYMFSHLVTASAVSDILDSCKWKCTFRYARNEC